jgi:hypothetical protein
MLFAAVVLLLSSGVAVKAPDPPKEIQDKVKAFEESVQKSSVYRDEAKQAIASGAAFYGKPYFIGGEDSGYFTFWLFNPNEKPTYRAYSILSTKYPVLMKTVLFAFEQKAQWVAVYLKSDNPNRVVYITVYP